MPYKQTRNQMHLTYGHLELEVTLSAYLSTIEFWCEIKQAGLALHVVKRA